MSSSFSWLTPFRALRRRQVCFPSAVSNLSNVHCQSAITHTRSTVDSWLHLEQPAPGCCSQTSAHLCCHVLVFLHTVPVYRLVSDIRKKCLRRWHPGGDMGHTQITHKTIKTSPSSSCHGKPVRTVTSHQSSLRMYHFLSNWSEKSNT